MTPARLRVLLAAAALVVVLSMMRFAIAQLLSPGPLSKAHASLEGDQHCGDCHSSGKRVDQGSCLKCHGDIGARIAAGKGLHGLQYRGKACEGCHAEHLGGGAPVRWPGGDPSKLDHSQTGWPLKGAHQQTPCNQCHNRANARGSHTYLGAPAACNACHKDVHQNRFGANCTNCHGEQSWKALDLASFNHDLARFVLRGAHQTTPCAKCHSEPPQYVGLKFAACTDCHKDVHRGTLGPTCTNCHSETRWAPARFKAGTHPGTSLANGHASVPCRACHDRGNLAAPSKGSTCVSCHSPVHQAPFGRNCATCHASIEWLGLPRSVGLSAHGKTEFALTGKHTGTDCAGCHKPSMPREARYRKLAFGRCADCHEDKHDGEFAKSDRGECHPCHATSGFRTTLFGIVAHSSTRFPLEGAHTASPCSECHSAKRPLLDLHVQKRACADCHENPHGDQFEKEMSQGGCAHCHSPNAWSSPKIDHSTWPLTGAHATADCDSCHHPTAEDRKTGRGPSYRGIARNCGGCHDDPHLGQFRLSEPSLECGKCHSTSVFKIPSFDHRASARWELTGAHKTVECAGCHPSATVAGGKATTRWRLPTAECTFCHANPHRKPRAAIAVSTKHDFTDEMPCSACHTTSAWRAKGAPGADRKFDHSKTGFPLTGHHIDTPCTDCHNAQRTLKRECSSCHEDSHRGRLSQACDKCHSPAGWRITRPLDIHRFTRFPLTGMHVLADCTECHVRASEQRWTDAPVACFACHEKDYRRPGIFPVHAGTATAPPLSRDCSNCHRSIAWVPANQVGSPAIAVARAFLTAPANHDLRFPISFGAHRSAACPDCHASQASPRAVRCIGCHAHEPAMLMQQHKQAVPSDGSACLSCHVAGVRR